MARCERCQADVPHEGAPCPSCGAVAEEGEDVSLIGQEILGRYRIVRLLAEGGMGRVYLAEQGVGSVVRRVAVKVVRPQLGHGKELLSRFAREAETLVRLTHPNTVQLSDFGTLPDGTMALVMEYVQGRSLSDELLRGPIPIARIERMLVQICGALKEAHGYGIVHRDLKPDNFVITERGGHGDFVKVLDFGIAKVSAAEEAKTEKLTQHGMIIGTPPYMSPEQFSGEPVDARSDVYSLGVIVYEMLTGRLPFEAKTPWEWATKHLTVEPAPIDPRTIPGASERHVQAIRRALAKKADQRPQGVDEFLALFCGSAPTLTSVAPPPGEPRVAPPRPTTSSFRGRGRGMLIAATSVGVLLAGGVLYAVKHKEEPAAQVVGATPPILPEPEPRPSTQTPPGTPSAPEPRAPAHTPEGATPPSTVGAVGDGSGTRPVAAEPVRTPPSEPSRAEATRASEGSSAHRPHRSSHAHESTPAPAAPAPEVAPAPAPVVVAPPPTPTVVQSAPPPMPPPPGARTSAPAVSSAPVQPAPSGVPPGLQSRLDRMRANMNGRIDQAAADYAAAETNYGTDPALSAMRAELAKAGEVRVRALLRDGDCKQAQALQRALVTNGVSPSSSSRQIFTGRCDPP